MEYYPTKSLYGAAGSEGERDNEGVGGLATRGNFIPVFKDILLKLLKRKKNNNRVCQLDICGFLWA